MISLNLTLIMFKASGESIRTQCNTSNIPVPSLDACEPSLENNQFSLLEFANWAQLVWFPLIIAAEIILEVVKKILLSLVKAPNLIIDTNIRKSSPSFDRLQVLQGNLVT